MMTAAASHPSEVPTETRGAEAVVIGASAGAMEALFAILPRLPARYPLPVMLVVHLPPTKSLLAELLQSRCQLAVREAEDKEPIRSGTVYVAPPDYHLLVEGDRSLSLSSEEPVHYSRPSIDVLFESASNAYRSGLVGIVLTGASSDGAAGLKAIHDEGGVALVQLPGQAHASIMPQAALDGCPQARALTLQAIGDFLLEVVESP